MLFFVFFCLPCCCIFFFFFFQAEDGIRDRDVTGVQTCALPILRAPSPPGDVLEVREPAPGGDGARTLPVATAAGLVAIVVAGSAAPLAEAIRAVAGELAFEWAPLAGDLATLEPHRARVSTRLLRALSAHLVAAGSRAEQVRLGFAALAEAAHALGDGLRARGQARLAAAGPDA